MAESLEANGVSQAPGSGRVREIGEIQRSQ